MSFADCIAAALANSARHHLFNDESHVSVAQTIAGHLSAELPALLELAEWATACTTEPQVETDYSEALSDLQRTTGSTLRITNITVRSPVE
jgi:hypothetical protein